MNSGIKLRWFAAFAVVLAIATFVRAHFGQAVPASQIEYTTYVSVLDRYGRFFSGLRPEHFAIEVNGVPQTITAFENKDEAMTVGFVIDKSGSQKTLDKYFPQLITLFTSLGHPSNEYFINGFNSEQAEFLDFTQDVGKVNKALKGISELDSSKETAFFDALNVALEKLERSRFKKRVLLFFSDCIDNSSKGKVGKLEERLKRSDVQLFIVSMSSHNMKPVPVLQYSVSAAEDYARLSGGKMFFPVSDGDVQSVIERVALLLRYQYKIGFLPTGKSEPLSENEWHKLKIKTVFKPKRTGDSKEEPKIEFLLSKPGFYLPAATK